MILDIDIDGKKVFFEVKDVAPISLDDMIKRSRYTQCIFLSLIIKDPQLSAHEWYSKVPLSICDKFMERIIKYQEERYV